MARMIPISARMIPIKAQSALAAGVHGGLPYYFRARFRSSECRTQQLGGIRLPRCLIDRPNGRNILGLFILKTAVWPLRIKREWNSWNS